MSHYDTLQIPKNASKDDIKKSYKKLALLHHPDRGGDEEQFKKITEAHEILSDDTKRQQYDNPSFFQQNTGFPQQGFPNPFGGFGGFEGIFKNFGGQQQQQKSGKLEDINVSLQITLEESIKGVTKTLQINYKSKCDCVKYCPGCNGEGFNNVMQQLGPFVSTVKMNCSVCDTKGVINPSNCNNSNNCNNTFKKETVENLDVIIPPGIPSLWSFRIPNKGTAAVKKNEMQGDLVANITILPDEMFKKDNNNLIYEFDIKCSDVLIGKSYNIHRFGEIIKFNVCIIDLDTKQIVLKERGIRWNNEIGDLIIKLIISYPLPLLNDDHKKSLKDVINKIGW